MYCLKLCFCQNLWKEWFGHLQGQLRPLCLSIKMGLTRYSLTIRVVKNSDHRSQRYSDFYSIACVQLQIGLWSHFPDQKLSCHVYSIHKCWVKRRDNTPSVLTSPPEGELAMPMSVQPMCTLVHRAVLCNLLQCSKAAECPLLLCQANTRVYQV